MPSVQHRRQADTAAATSGNLTVASSATPPPLHGYSHFARSLSAPLSVLVFPQGCGAQCEVLC